MSKLLGFVPLLAWGIVVAAIAFYAIRKERIELRKAGGKRS